MASIEPTKYRTVVDEATGEKTREPLPGTRWKVRYRKPNGKQGSKVFDRKSDAKRFIETNGADLQRGEWVDPKLRRKLFDDWADDWWATVARLAPTTRRGYWFLLENHVRPYFSGMVLTSIDWLDVEKFITHLRTEKGLGPKQTRHAVSVLSLIMKVAIRSGARQDNPTVGHELALRKRKVRKREMLTMEQVERFVAALHPWYQPAGWMLIYTGYRPAELCGAKVRDLDFMRSRIEVEETRMPVGRFADQPYQMVQGPTKSAAGDRSIPIPRWLSALIAEQLAERAAKLGVAQLPPDAPLFVSRWMNPLNRDSFRKQIVRPALVAAGLPEDFRTYDFRHTHASLLIDLGANILAIQQRMGHSEPSVTMNVYGHLYEDRQEELTEQLDSTRTQRVPKSDEAEVIELRRAEEA